MTGCSVSRQEIKRISRLVEQTGEKRQDETVNKDDCASTDVLLKTTSFTDVWTFNRNVWSNAFYSVNRNASVSKRPQYDSAYTEGNARHGPWTFI